MAGARSETGEGLVGGQVQEKGRDEVFARFVVGGGEVGEVAVDVVVQGGGEAGQAGVAGGGEAEGAEQEGGFTDRGRTFAAYVPDQQAGGVVGAGGGVEVAADLGLLRGGEMAAGDLSARRSGPDGCWWSARRAGQR
nr:hypothetical protein [Streptomyces corchorusii]